MIKHIQIIAPESVHDQPYCAHGTKVLIEGTEVRNLTDIVVKYPVLGPVTVDLTVLATGQDKIDFEGFADVKLKISEHPWQAFLLARKDAITWLAEQGNNPKEIAQSLSMDEVQVKLIASTDRKSISGE